MKRSEAQAGHAPVSWIHTSLPAESDRREYARETARVVVTEAIAEAMDSAGITRSELARRLGVTKGYVSKLFAGQNLTLRSVGELLYACGFELRDIEVAQLGVVFVPLADAARWSVESFARAVTSATPTNSSLPELNAASALIQVDVCAPTGPVPDESIALAA
jgi:transcriptional regulator with XRE-family HTH domain